jgi:predicted Zn-dependent protease with MMP-like domain
VTVAELIEDVRATLPDSIRAELAGVRVFVKGSPDAVDIRRGCDPRLEGYFFGTRGGDDEEMGNALPDPGPAQGEVVLFVNNFRELSRTHVRKVLLHELSHALGCDEDDMQCLGLGA